MKIFPLPLQDQTQGKEPREILSLYIFFFNQKEDPKFILTLRYCFMIMNKPSRAVPSVELGTSGLLRRTELEIPWKRMTF